MSCWHDVPDVPGQPTLTEIFDNFAKELKRELTDDEKHTIMHGVLAGRSAPEIINIGGATFEEAMATKQLGMQLRAEARAKAKLDRIAKKRKPTVLLDNIDIKTPKTKVPLFSTYSVPQGKMVRFADGRKVALTMEEYTQCKGPDQVIALAEAKWSYELKERQMAQMAKQTALGSYDEMMLQQAEQERRREQRIRQERMAEQMARSMDPVGWKGNKS